MKKTKFLTCLATLALLLAGCEIVAEDIGSDTSSTESSDTTTSDTGTTEGGDGSDDGNTGTGSGESGDTGTGGDGSGDGDGGDGGNTQETPVTYTYSIEVANAEELKGLEYDGALESQTGVELSIYLVTTPSEGDETKEPAKAEDVTFSGYDQDKISINGLLVIPEGEGETTLTVSATTYGSTTVDVTVSDVTDYDALALAENLEKTKEALEGLGSDPCSSWEAYKYSYNEDEDVASRLLAKEVNGYLYGYSKDSEKEVYYKDGVAYTANLIEETYETEEASQDIYNLNLSEDELFVTELVEMLDEVEENDVYTLSDITIEGGVYTIEISKFEDANELGTDNYDSTYTLTIINDELVSASRETTQTHVKGTCGEESGTKTIKEEIAKVDANSVTLDGFDETLWQEEEDPNVPIVEAILSSAASLYEEFNEGLEAWTAVHVSAVEFDDDDPDYDRFYLADNEGSAYGYLEHQETFPSTSFTYTYITEDLARYSKDVNEEGEITSTSYGETYYASIADLIDDYQGPLEEAGDYTDYFGNVDISDLEYELESDESDGYKLVINVETGDWTKTEYTYTYYADANCNLTAYTTTSGDNEDGLFYRVEECALEDVTTKLEAVKDELDSWPVSGVQLQFTFNLENEAQSIPEGATVYYVEDNTPYAITTSGGRYVVDLGLMSVGTHTYSIIITGGELEEAVTIAEDLTYDISFDDSGLIKQLTIELEKSFEDYLGGDEQQDDEPQSGQGSASIYDGDQRYHIYEDGTIEVHQADENGACTVCETTDLNIANITYVSKTDDDGEPYYLASTYSTSATATELYIPTTYEGVPVKAVGKEGVSSYSNGGWANTNLQFIAIPNTITSFNAYAFAKCGVVTVNIPSSVIALPEGVFRYCESLQNVDFSDGLESIGNRAFENCIALESIDFPDSVTELGTYVCDNCTNLVSASIPDTINAIPDALFCECTALVNFDIPDSVTSIGSSAFDKCYYYVPDIPDGVTLIDDYAFRYSYIESIDLPSELVTIGDQAFRYCYNLTSVALPDKVEKLETWVFGADSNIKYVVVPASMASIGTSAFNGCSGIEAVYYGGASETEWNSISITTTNSGNTALSNADRYYYDEDGSAYANDTDGKYWHYDELGNIVIYGAA